MGRGGLMRQAFAVTVLVIAYALFYLLTGSGLSLSWVVRDGDADREAVKGTRSWVLWLERTTFGDDVRRWHPLHSGAPVSHRDGDRAAAPPRAPPPAVGTRSIRQPQSPTAMRTSRPRSSSKPARARLARQSNARETACFSDRWRTATRASHGMSVSATPSTRVGRMRSSRTH